MCRNTAATDSREIEHLDFDPTVPCEYHLGRGACELAAEWVIRYAILVRPGVTLSDHQLIVCTGHKDRMVGHVPTCPNCSKLIAIKRVDAL